mmetsp:Transcript_62820/g.164739  ORF Transcript_62820/g.164739 Transcript_62820/m.164739 type:complete len:231 (+) Transcript_62820:513-1205(+)
MWRLLGGFGGQHAGRPLLHPPAGGPHAHEPEPRRRLRRRRGGAALPGFGTLCWPGLDDARTPAWLPPAAGVPEPSAPRQLREPEHHGAADLQPPPGGQRLPWSVVVPRRLGLQRWRGLGCLEVLLPRGGDGHGWHAAGWLHALHLRPLLRHAHQQQRLPHLRRLRLLLRPWQETRSGQGELLRLDNGGGPPTARRQPHSCAGVADAGHGPPGQEDAGRDARERSAARLHR